MEIQLAKEMFEVSQNKYKSAMFHKDQQRDLLCQIGEKKKKAMDKLVNSVNKLVNL